jgi:hypothetical protein
MKRKIVDGNTVMWFSNPDKTTTWQNIQNRLWIIYAGIFEPDLIGLVRRGK